MTPIRKQFSKNLKHLRIRKGLTQEELAEKLDISARYIQKLEGVNCPSVRIDTVAQIAKALGVTASELLES